MNVHHITGRLGADPEFKELSNGNSMVKLSVATSKKWTDKEGNKQEKTTWHTVKAWGKQAEVLNQWFKKGSWINLYGPVEVDVVEKEDGTKQYYTSTRVDRFEFVGSKSDDSREARDAQSATHSSGLPNHAPKFDENESVPF